MSDTALQSSSQLRVRIFIDFWSFTLELRRQDDAFRVDWNPIGGLLTKEARKIVDAGVQASFEGMHVYGYTIRLSKVTRNFVIGLVIGWIRGLEFILFCYLDKRRWDILSAQFVIMR